MRHSHIFGSEGVYLVPSADRKKMDNHSRRCYFLGVLPHGDGVKVLDKHSNKIIKTRDAMFDEVIEPIKTPSSPQSDHHHHPETTSWLLPDDNIPINQDSDLGNQPDVNQHQDAQNHNPDPILHRPQRYRLPPSRYGNLQAHSSVVNNSPTSKTAMSLSDRSSWITAMKVEIDSFIERNFFTLVPRPINGKVILCRWHLKKKLNLDGSLKKFKARLVARGFTQRKGINYQEKFAPSRRQESLKDFLAVNRFKDWDMIQLDVVGAFLYGYLDEEIYLSQPEGFIDQNHPDHVWKLNSSLYGLKQSARQWHQCLSDQLKAIGFQAAQVDLSLHILKQNNVIVSMILVHVDDILLAGTNKSIKFVESILNKKFKLTQNKDVSQFLSFDITWDRKNKTFTMNQASYVNDLVETHHLEDARRVSTPCDHMFRDLKKNDDPTLVTDRPYCSLIGALMWLSNGTRPDITFAVNRLSSLMNSPTDIHWRDAQRVLIYVRDTSSFSITLGGDYLTLSGHSDSDWAEQREDRRSTTGFIFSLGKSPVS